jgi:flagella basal body P-ring formation protein FlgA
MTMTTKTTESETTGRRVGKRRPKDVAPAPGEVVAPAPKLRRRPVLVAASVAAVCLGALLGVWAWTSTSNTHEVVAVRHTIARGETISRDALMTVQVGVDPGLKVLPGGRLAGLVGQRAAMDMSAGSLVTEEDVAAKVVPGQGMSVVGVGLPRSLMPGEALRPGDQVRVIATPGAQGVVTEGQQVAITASVVGLYPNADNGQTVVAVEVPQERAAELAARSATGKVAIVLDSRER